MRDDLVFMGSRSQICGFIDISFPGRVGVFCRIKSVLVQSVQHLATERAPATIFELDFDPDALGRIC